MNSSLQPDQVMVHPVHRLTCVRVHMRVRVREAKLREHTEVNAHLHRPAVFPWECTCINLSARNHGQCFC